MERDVIAMKKKNRILFIIIILMLLTGSSIYIYISNQQVKITTHTASGTESNPDDMLTSAEVEEDRNQAIEFIESVHPYFVDGSDITPYEDAKDKYIKATRHKMSLTDFQAATAEYFCFFRDGHTCVWLEEEDYLDLYPSYHDGHMYTQDGKEKDQYITAIDDVNAEEIFAIIDKEIPAENEMAREINYNNYFNAKNILGSAGVDMSKELFTVKLSDGSSFDCTYLSEEDKKKFEDIGEDIENSWSMEGDIFVIHFVQCIYDDHLKDIAAKLKEAIEDGCTKVIIDARDNPGGDSTACEVLIKAMGMTPPSYGDITRYSPEAKQQRTGYVRDSGTSSSKGSTDCIRNSEVNLVVLCNRYTFSSATMLCVYVRDGKLGTLIGEPSSNMPNCYGDIIYVTLGNSQIKANASHRRFIRPNSSNNERMLVPDIETTGSGAYDAAIEFLETDRAQVQSPNR